MNNRGLKTMAVYLVIVLMAMTFIQFGAPMENTEITQADIKDYTQLMAAVDADRVSEIIITPSADGNTLTVEGKLTDGSVFTGIVTPQTSAAELTALNKEGVSVSWMETPEPPFWMSLLTSLLPILLMVGLFIFLMNQSSGGGGKVMQFGKSKAKVVIDEKNKVTFDDVAGADEVKEELEEIVEFLKSPKKFNDIGAKIPKGVLLYGPPGTGKTLLARAVAGEAGVAFFSISGSDFVEMFVGVGASRVRDLFEQAKKNSPCIIFIDEIDAVGRQRGAGVGGGHDERERTASTATKVLLSSQLPTVLTFWTQHSCVRVVLTAR